MPVRSNSEVQTVNGKKVVRCFWQFGQSGKKYYFKCGDKAASKKAKAKAVEQQSAAYAGGWKGD